MNASKSDREIKLAARGSSGKPIERVAAGSRSGPRSLQPDIVGVGEDSDLHPLNSR